jgi:SPP1 gp7 family putative phage head morphogenesis protein
MAEPLSIGFDVEFEEAVRAAEQRGVTLPEIYYGELQGISRQLAFSIAGVASFDQLSAVKDSLASAIESGQTFRDWAASVDVQALELPEHRLDNIFRTNLQGSYQRGKWEQFARNKQRRPYLMYDAINDSRVRPSHLAMDNAIKAVDDPFWVTHAPPNGYRCRCTLVSLTEAQALARTNVDKGLNKQPVTEDGTPAQPDAGWDYNPAEDMLRGINDATRKRLTEAVGPLADALREKMTL